MRGCLFKTASFFIRLVVWVPDVWRYELCANCLTIIFKTRYQFIFFAVEIQDMSTTIHKPAILVLADGSVHHGQSFGKIGTTTGEICFNTGMTGYQEVFTDPSYYGQVII